MQFDSTSNSEFQTPPVGTHLAKLIRIVDLGTQEGEYQGKPTKRRQSLFTWELPFETMEDGRPFIISKFYTQSLGEKANLTKDLASWLGKAPTPPTKPEENAEFVENTIKPLLNKGCQIVVSERENGKKVVSAVTGLGKGTVVPEETHNPVVFFDLNNYDDEVFDGLSDRIKEMIMKTPEYDKIINGEPAAVAESTDIPF